MFEQNIDGMIQKAKLIAFPESLHILMSILDRLPHPRPGPKRIYPLPDQSIERLKEVVVANIFTIKHQAMDPINELLVLQTLSENLEAALISHMPLLFPADNKNSYDMFCKLISYCISLKLPNALRSCANHIKALDISHPLRFSIMSTIRTDFCQFSSNNYSELKNLPKLSKDLTSIFINTLCLHQTHLPDVLLWKLIADWISSEKEILSAIRLQISLLVRWNIMSFTLPDFEDEIRWRVHYSILYSLQNRQRAMKPTFLSGTDARSWVECVQTLPDEYKSSSTDIVLQVLHVSVSTQSLHLTKEDSDWCFSNLHKTEFHELLRSTGSLSVN